MTNGGNGLSVNLISLLLLVSFVVMWCNLQRRYKKNMQMSLISANGESG